MKSMLAMIFIFGSFSVFANTKAFNIQLDNFEIDGNPIPQQRKFEVKPHETMIVLRSASTEGAEYIVDFSASDDDSLKKGGILMNFEISEELNGKRRLISTPRIIALSGQKVTMSSGPEGGAPNLKITVLGKRIQK